MFKACNDLLGGINPGLVSSLGWLPNFKEEEWTGRSYALVIEIRLEEIFFNAGKNWENDEEMCSCEVLFCASVLDFEVLSINIMTVEFNLEFFRWINFDSNVDWNDKVGSECEDSFEDSYLGKVSSVS